MSCILAVIRDFLRGYQRRGQARAAAAYLFGCFVYDVLHQYDREGGEAGYGCDYQ